MVYSTYCFLENLVLKPFYDNYSSTCNEAAKSAGIQVDNLPNYAKAVSPTATGLTYVISQLRSGDYQYVNNYMVDFTNSKNSTTLVFTGHLQMQTTISADSGICVAQAWANAETDWTASVVIESAKDDKGNPTVTISTPAPSITYSNSSERKNSCAMATEIIENFSKNFNLLFLQFFDPGFVVNIFLNLNPLITSGSFAKNIPGSVMLPGGQ